MRIRSPYRYDHVGSFLRPEHLKEARAAFAREEISAEELKKIEDEAIRDLVQKQKDLGYKIVTDGEFRRATWYLDFMWAFDGVSHKPTETGIPFSEENAMVDDTYLTGNLSISHHPFVDHYRFVQSLCDDTIVAKQTIPAPAQFLEQFIFPFNLEGTLTHYESIEALEEDIVEGYAKVLQELYDAGCRNVQLDDCSWGVLVDENAKFVFGTDEEGVENYKKKFLDINNRVIRRRPEGLTITTHVCRGNFHSSYASSGAYDSVAAYLFAQEEVDAFFLEFDDERSGGFEPLAEVPIEKKVVLGLVTSKRPDLEEKEHIKKRIIEASKYIPIERLCLSPQCGFASCEIGNILTEEEQWRKLRLVKEIADEVWN